MEVDVNLVDRMSELGSSDGASGVRNCVDSEEVEAKLSITVAINVRAVREYSVCTHNCRWIREQLVEFLLVLPVLVLRASVTYNCGNA